jgi:hypothetical protein
MYSPRLQAKLDAMEREAELLGVTIDFKRLAHKKKTGRLNRLPPMSLPPISPQHSDTSGESPFTVGSERSISPCNSMVEGLSPSSMEKNNHLFAPINHFAIASQGIPQICPIDSSFSTPRPVVYKSIRVKNPANSEDFATSLNIGNDAKKIYFSTPGCSKNAGLPLIFKDLTKGEILN